MPKNAVHHSGAMYPNPVILVTAGHDDEANIITLAWAGTLCGDPWMVGIGVRPGRHSHGLIHRYREFVVNVPTIELLSAVEICGSKSGASCDKWAEARLTREPSQVLKTPSIAQCPVSIECRLRHALDLGQHRLFVGQVVATRKDPAWGFSPPPLVYMEGRYWRVGTEMA
jgi:flavin reductase (DIM6/NTAB) family NADH-FMN oxidoreductase RutF